MKKLFALLSAFFIFSFIGLAQDNNAKVFEFKKINGQWAMYSDGTTVEMYVDNGGNASDLVKAEIEGRSYIMESSDWDEYQKVYGKTASTNVQPAEKEKKEKDKKLAVEKITSVGTSQIPTKSGWIMIPDVSVGIATTKVDKDGVVKKNTFTISNIASTVLSGVNLVKGNPVYTTGGWFNMPVIY